MYAIGNLVRYPGMHAYSEKKYSRTYFLWKIHEKFYVFTRITQTFSDGDYALVYHLLSWGI